MSKKLNSLKQAHGKLENPVTLDQIWGDTGTSKYGTLNYEEYENYLRDLNKSDLQSHASKIGLVPIDDREKLVKRLTSEFIKYASIYNKPKLKEEKKSLSKKAKDILSEGR
jgi:hypothetical protein